MHTLERQREQLEMAGIGSFPPPATDWLECAELDIALSARLFSPVGVQAKPGHDEENWDPAGRRADGLDLVAQTAPAPSRGAALLIPGAAPHRPRKRWPAGHFGELAALLAERGQISIIVGSAQEAPLAAAIRDRAPSAIDLTGRTGLRDLAAIAARAAVAIGNDTGPMHLASAVGTPCIVLFSADSDPALTRPRGPCDAQGEERVTVLSAPDLADLPVERVAQALPPVH